MKTSTGMLVITLVAAMIGGAVSVQAAERSRGSSAVANTLDVFSGFPQGSRQYRSFLGGAKRTFELRNSNLRIAVHARDAEDLAIDMAVQLRNGTFHAALLTAAEAETVLPGSLVYARPFLFCNAQEIHRLRERFDGTLLSALENDAFRAIDIVGLDSLHFLSAEPIASVEAIRGNPVFVPENLERIRIWLSELGLDVRPFDIREPAATGGWGEVDSLYLNMPVALILDSDLPRPPYLGREPVTYTYFVVVINRERMATLSNRQREEFADYLRQVAGRLNDLHERGARRSRDMLTGSDMEPVGVGGWNDFVPAEWTGSVAHEALHAQLQYQLRSLRGGGQACPQH